MESVAAAAVPVWLPSDGCEPSETEKESRVLASFSTLLMNRSQSVRLLVLTCLLALASGPARAASDHPVILIVGDSISAGFGVPVQQGYATLLEQQLQEHMAGTQVVNASVSGDTTQGGVARLPQLLEQHHPDLLLIELGGNDGLRGTPLKLIRQNIERMIRMAEERGTMVMLLGMQIPPNYGQRYTKGFADIYPQLAEQYDTLLVPFLLEGVATNPELMQGDGIHPTAEAQPILQQLVMDELRLWLELHQGE